MREQSPFSYSAAKAKEYFQKATEDLRGDGRRKCEIEKMRKRKRVNTGDKPIKRKVS